MNIESHINELEDLLERHTDADAAVYIRKYFKNQFDSFGLKNGFRRELTRSFMAIYKNASPEIISSAIRHLWEKPQREFQHTGMELVDKYRKQMGAAIKPVLELMITRKGWWDTVDFIAGHTVGWAYSNQVIDLQTIKEWNKSNHIWLIRTSILFQLKYKSSTDWNLLQEMIIPQVSHTDFFIRKAIGWALREYSKTDPQAVLDFVNNHSMSGLSQREALRIIVS